MKKGLLIFGVCLMTITQPILSQEEQKTEKTTSAITEYPYLKGLKLIPMSEMSGKPLTLDGETIPVYSVEGKRLYGEEMFKTIGSGEYTIEPYGNNKKEIKIIQLKLASEGEKKMYQTITNRQAQPEGTIDIEAPAFSCKTITGKEIDLNDLKGKVVVINFWFIACKPCVQEIPELNKLVEKYKNENVVFLGIAQDDAKQLKQFLKKHPFDYSIVPEGCTIAKDYQTNAFPTHIVIDQNGVITYNKAGLDPESINELSKQIESLLKR